MKNNDRTGLEIAIIGVSCRFPGASNKDEFYSNLKNGIMSLSFLSDEEITRLSIPDKILKNKNYVKAKGGVLSDKELFDSDFFGYMPSEAQCMNPQTRIFHECIWEALEDGGYISDTYNGKIGLFAGSSSSFLWEAYLMLSGLDKTLGSFQTFHLANKDHLATRISYKLNLKGPSISLQTACSTSLVAVDLACKSLLTGQSDMCLAGGITINSGENKGYIYEEGMPRSEDGYCRAFDASATGMVGGEGVGVILLKPLEQAILDRDNIYAVIKGSAINNDGNRKVGYSAPSVTGQAEVIKSAYNMAEIKPESIEYIETHGTGTKLGDVVEIGALVKSFNTKLKGICGLGSVKTNFGHLDSASGIAGLIKVILSLKNQELFPTLNFKTNNSEIDFDSSPFYINTELKKWLKNNSPRRAGVSSFGIGGTNVHIVLEESPEIEYESKNRNFCLLTVSARTHKALEKQIKNLNDYCLNQKELKLPDISYTMNVGRKELRYRKSFVFQDTTGLLEVLRTEQNQNFFDSNSLKKSKLVFVFSGQGSQYVNMGLGIYREEPVFRDHLDTLFNLIKDKYNIDLYKIIFQADINTLSENEIKKQDISQVILFTFQYAIAKLLMFWGILPDAMIGYSVGEYVAACISGVLSVEDAIKLIIYRGKLMATVINGSMLSLPLTEEQLLEIIPSTLSISAVNGPTCVVSGENKHIHDFEQLLKSRKILSMKLPVEYPGHSHIIESILDNFRNIVSGVQFNKPNIPYISSMTGNWITVEQATQAGYWVEHLRQPVRFYGGIHVLANNDFRKFVEIGPGHDLNLLINRQLPADLNKVVISTIRNSKIKIDDYDYLLRSMGKIWCSGTSINWDNFYKSEKRRRLSLPTYPFERNTYPAELDTSNLANWSNGSVILKRTGEIKNCLYYPTWYRTPLLQSKLDIWNKVFLIFCSENEFSKSLTELIVQYGGKIIKVHSGSDFVKKDNSHYVVNPTLEDNYKKCIESIESSGILPDRIIHCWSISKNQGKIIDETATQDRMNKGFHSLINIAKAAGYANTKSDLLLSVITNQMLSVFSNDKIVPDKNTLMGPVMTIPKEYKHIKCICVDIESSFIDNVPDKNILQSILNERNDSGKDYSVAYREALRYEKTYQPINHLSCGTSDLLKKGGIYLITGGLHGIGFEIAKYISQTVEAKLIIIGRSVFDKRVSKDGKTNEEKVQILEKNNSEVYLINADVSDFELMKFSLDEIEKKIGKINGVVHSAGIPGGAMIQTRTREYSQKLFKAKISGTIVLDRIFNHRNLDFFIINSSGNSIFAAVGQSDYCAANAYLDAYAQFKSNKGQNITKSINWSRWKGIGMSIEVEAKHKQLTGNEREDGFTRDEAIEIFKIAQNINVPQIIVSEQDINTIVTHNAHYDESFFKQRSATNFLNIKYKRSELSTKYVSPNDHCEKELTLLWEEFFKMDQIGTEDNFFELGGDSLKAMLLIPQIYKRLNVEILVGEFFQKPTIKEISEFIKATGTKQYKPFPQAEKKEYYTLSSLQKNFYLIQKLDPDTTGYNSSNLLRINDEIGESDIKKFFDEVIARHEILRTTFEEINGIPYQRVHKSFNITIQTIEVDDKSLRDWFDKLQKPFVLNQLPLIRVYLLKSSQKFLFIDIHHIITDAISQNILINEFISFQNSLKLPLVYRQYRDFSEWKNSRIHSEKHKRQEVFWKNEFKDEIPVLAMPTDFKRPLSMNFNGKKVFFILEEKQLCILKSITKSTRSTLFNTLIGIFNIFLAKLSGLDDIVVGTPISGRNHPDLKNMVGLFLNTLPLRNFPKNQMSVMDFLVGVRTNSFKAFENQDYNFENLISVSSHKKDPSRNILFDVFFNLIPKNEMVGEENDINEKYTEFGSQNQKHHLRNSKFDLMLEVEEIDEKVLLCNFQYKISLFKEETIDRYIIYLKNIISFLESNLDKKISDIGLTSNENKEKRILQFNEDLE